MLQTGEHWNRSAVLFERAQRVLPGGVNSPVRAFCAVGGIPPFMVSGRGARLWTVDGRELMDFCGSWGALLFGHARPEIVEAVCRAARDGLSFGANTVGEVEVAERLVSRIPGVDRIRLVSTGTESVMTAIRLARGHTGRTRLLKFSGCYHGHSDGVLAEAGSGLLTQGIASSAGVPGVVAAEVRVVAYNDLEAAESVMRREGDQVAAILVEPVAANMGLVLPEPGFLEGLRRLADQSGAVLIFDEVITGFRFGPTTYGSLAGIRPDLVCLGKIVGGGLPLAAVGGQSEIMEKLAPVGGVYQAGTLSGNPLVVAAALSTLDLIEREPPYALLAGMGDWLAVEAERVFREAGWAACCSQKGGVFTFFFTRRRPRNLSEVHRTDRAAYSAVFHHLLERGFYLPPSPFEVGFLSAAHTPSDVAAFLSAFWEVVRELSPRRGDTMG